MTLRFRLKIMMAFTLLALPLSSSAKDLYGRMGLGYNAQFTNTSMANGVPALSFKYGLSKNTVIQAIGGYYSGSVSSGVAALKFLQTIHPENYLNFYFMFGGGILNANNRSGTEFLGGLGTEFYIPGVDSVGISFEAGVSVESLSSNSGNFVLKTFGVSFIHAGMHFYL